jgi:hypothetical protein
MASRLFDRMNNLLFRQQGLLWARRACDALDLRLQIYGTGWDKHPDFAAHACGTIEYGGALENLTRTAGVNLVLEPFVCIAHQRLLDALVAGGFCLLRANPATQIIHATIELLALAGEDAETASMVRQRLGASHGADLDQLQAAIDAIDTSPGAVDHFALTRQLQQSGFFPMEGELLPMLDQTTFDSPDHLMRFLSRFSRDESLRSDIARAQRQAVEQRYNYVAGMRQVVRFVASRLQNEPQLLTKAA